VQGYQPAGIAAFAHHTLVAVGWPNITTTTTTTTTTSSIALPL
jgi:hypothetical protein